MDETLLGDGIKGRRHEPEELERAACLLYMNRVSDGGEEGKGKVLPMLRGKCVRVYL